MEAVGYAVGAVPFPSAGVGAPHIRDRLYWVAHADNTGLEGRSRVRQRADQLAVGAGGMAGIVADTDGPGCGARSQGRAAVGYGATTKPDCGAGRLADAAIGGRREKRPNAGGGAAGDRAEGVAAGSVHGGGAVRLAHAIMQQRSDGQPGFRHVDGARGRIEGAAEVAGLRGDLRAGPTNGYWRAADWLLCRDGKWRPVEPGTFPLVDGTASRVGRGGTDWRTAAGIEGKGHRTGQLKGYGNAINAEAAVAWIECVMETF